MEAPNVLRPKVGPRRVFSLAHNFHFSPRSLAFALHQAGFRAVALREFYRDSFQLLASAEPGHRPAARGERWQDVVRAVRRHERRYLLTLQFVWRKIPRLRDAIMYRLRRDLTGAAAQNWLNGRAVRRCPASQSCFRLRSRLD